MVQINIQGATLNPLALVESPVPLEVQVYEVTRSAKMRLYARVQAFSDTNQVIGAYNPQYQMTVIVPQDFLNGDNIENLMTHLIVQDQVLRDIEGNYHAIRVNHVGELHQGGVPLVWQLDIAAYETYDSRILSLSHLVPYPDINTLVSVDTTNSLNVETTMPMIFFANGLIWAVQGDGLDQVWYQTSPDGAIWSTRTNLTTNGLLGGGADGGGVLYVPSLNRVYYQFSNGALHQMFWRWGTPNPNGTITWGISEQEFDTPYAFSFTTFDVDSNGNLWSSTLYGAPFSGGIQGFAIWKNGVQVKYLPQSNTDFAWTISPPVIRVSQTNPNNIMAYALTLGWVSPPTAKMYYSTDGGTTWSSFIMPTAFSTEWTDAVVIGNVAYIVYPTGVSPGHASDGTGPIHFVSYNIGDNHTSAETTLDTIPSGFYEPGVSIATDGVSTLVVVYTDNSALIRDRVSTNSGSSWSVPKTIVTTGGFGYPPVSVLPLIGSNGTILLEYLGPYSGGFLLYAGGALY